MAIQFHPSASARIEAVSTQDPAVAAANDADALNAYRRTGDLKVLAVPDDATRVTLAPLTASAAAQAARDPGVPSDALLQEAARQKADREAGIKGAPSNSTLDLEAAAWNDAYALALLRYSVKAVSDFPDVKPVRRGALECYPDEVLERIEITIRREFADHVVRISHLGTEGKAS